MEPKSRLILAALFGSAVLLGALASTFSAGIANAQTAYKVTTSTGITMANAVDAYWSQSVRDDLGVRNVLMFAKSGGNDALGQKPQILRVDLPVKVKSGGEDISVQYFVDVSNDLSPSPMVHCGDVRLHVYVGGVKVYVTPWMGYEGRNPGLPLQTAKLTIHDVPAGWRDIGFVPEGRAGGCNVGATYSWGGTGVVFD
jgi:hypothetical protein